MLVIFASSGHALVPIRAVSGCGVIFMLGYAVKIGLTTHGGYLLEINLSQAKSVHYV